MAAVWAVQDGRAMWSGRLLAEWVPPLVAQIVDACDPEAVWLFGSLARGDDGADSDIDLLVVLSEFDPAATMEWKRKILRAVSVPAPFDVSFTDPLRLRTRGRIAGTLERAVIREGRAVYERR